MTWYGVDDEGDEIWYGIDDKGDDIWKGDVVGIDYKGDDQVWMGKVMRYG